MHRDLKPDNIKITRAGCVKVMDFGLARQEDQADLTRTGAALGTPRYMSPEHMNARSVSPASDIYSVGVMLYQMLTGRFPFEGDDVWSLFAQVLTQTPPTVSELRPQVPEALSEAVMHMIRCEAGERYAWAEEAIEALSQAFPQGQHLGAEA